MCVVGIKHHTTTKSMTSNMFWQNPTPYDDQFYDKQSFSPHEPTLSANDGAIIPCPANVYALPMSLPCQTSMLCPSPRAAKTRVLPKSTRCQNPCSAHVHALPNPRAAKTRVLPKSTHCQNACSAKTHALPMFTLCQSPRAAKTRVLPKFKGCQRSSGGCAF